ncbi:histidine kinase [Pseudonocardia sp. EC080610-09]|uniref:sensor histidine kinase n=1 Tax=unclassified Pseudonocardia TaxID=2619320 RepID=UPI0006CB3E78|nr:MULTISPECIES: ATP-binding protein [unclassified Pseudonocardia]ALE72037.1 histidine kinase [Pseudonocardia sp. EC080625-04]ALL75316.1 histidine kinase [Pseudonocardia sp. EC080610-09]ALL82341.1 histidine kinase [Pseudonocardia sp. EC080619-01]
MRRRILVLVGATVLLVLVAFAIPLATLIRSVAEDSALSGATSQARSLTPTVATGDRAAMQPVVQGADAADVTDVSVFLPGGDIVGAPAPRSRLVELGLLGQSASTDAPGGREMVFAVQGTPAGNAAIRVFVPDDELYRGVVRSWLLLAGLSVVLLAGGLLVADRLARTLVDATTDLSEVSERLARGDLSARADPEAPAELGVVAGALNGLAGRISELLKEERENVADLAHRVRTPLTALRLDAEALRDPDESARISSGVDGVQRAVTGAIEQARRRGGESRSADAAAVVRERVEFWQVLAEDTDRAVTLDLADGPLPVGCARGDLEACVDALLGNVFAHTPDGTAFGIELTGRSRGGARLVVTDHGPGLPPGSDPTSRGVSGGGSTGLGLDIARRTADSGGGRLALHSPPGGGLQVELELAAPAE